MTNCTSGGGGEGGCANRKKKFFFLPRNAFFSFPQVERYINGGRNNISRVCCPFHKKKRGKKSSRWVERHNRDDGDDTETRPLPRPLPLPLPLYRHSIIYVCVCYIKLGFFFSSHKCSLLQPDWPRGNPGQYDLGRPNKAFTLFCYILIVWLLWPWHILAVKFAIHWELATLNLSLSPPPPVRKEQWEEGTSYPTNNALLISFRLSSDTEILFNNHRLSKQVGTKSAKKNVYETCTCSDWAFILHTTRWWLGTLSRKVEEVIKVRKGGEKENWR